MDINISDKTITLPRTPGRVKKITGTRFAAILGLNPWCTPFEAWCDMTGTYKIPFEDNKFTLAGKAIEPLVIRWLDERYYFGMNKLRSADDWFGKTKEQLYYDHFPGEKIFGGMWDARTDGAVFELKTTKRAEDWYKGGSPQAPEYYKLQGALYAYLLGLDDFRLVLTLLEDGDYENPGEFKPDVKNTTVIKYSLAAEYPDFIDKINYCLEWYDKHIKAHVSPAWDDKKDAEIMKELTTGRVENTGGDELTELISAIEPLQARIDAANAELSADESLLKDLKERLRSELSRRMRTSDKKITADGTAYSFEVSRTSAGLDTDRLRADGLYDTYRKEGYTYKLNIKSKENAS